MTSPLESLLRPIAALLNRQIEAKTPARELCAELAGSVFAIRLKDSALAMYFTIAADHIILSSEYDKEPDVVISGSLLSLASMAGPAASAGIREGDVRLEGNALLAQKFQKLLGFARPDLEEELSGLVGDAAAHSIGTFVRSVGDWGKDVRSTLLQNVSEYLREESREVPSRYETEAFRSSVGALRDDVARFEVRLRQLETSLNPRDSK